MARIGDFAAHARVVLTQAVGAIEDDQRRGFLTSLVEHAAGTLALFAGKRKTAEQLYRLADRIVGMQHPEVRE